MGTLTVEECTEKHGLSTEQAEALSSLNNPLTGSRTARQQEWFERLDICLELGISNALIAEISGKPVSWIDRDVLRARTQGYCRHQPEVGEQRDTATEMPAVANGEAQEVAAASPDNQVTDAAEEPGPSIQAETPDSDPSDPSVDDSHAAAIPAGAEETADRPTPEASAAVDVGNDPEPEPVEPAPPAPASGREMSDDHKAAIALGRIESRAVSDYLSALDSQRPQRGRHVPTEVLLERKASAEEALSAGGIKALKRLSLLQEVRDLDETLAQRAESPDMSSVEEGFVTHAASYSQRKGIHYATWREIGVPADLLARAGIARRVA